MILIFRSILRWARTSLLLWSEFGSILLSPKRWRKRFSCSGVIWSSQYPGSAPYWAGTGSYPRSYPNRPHGYTPFQRQGTVIWCSLSQLHRSTHYDEGFFPGKFQPAGTGNVQTGSGWNNRKSPRKWEFEFASIFGPTSVIYATPNDDPNGNGWGYFNATPTPNHKYVSTFNGKETFIWCSK